LSNTERTIVTQRPATSTNLTCLMGRIAFARAVMMGPSGDRQTVALETLTAAKPWAAKHQITAEPGMEDE